jgi:hypothetical protein
VTIPWSSFIINAWFSKQAGLKFLLGMSWLVGVAPSTTPFPCLLALQHALVLPHTLGYTSADGGGAKGGMGHLTWGLGSQKGVDHDAIFKSQFGGVLGGF